MECYNIQSASLVLAAAGMEMIIATVGHECCRKNWKIRNIFTGLLGKRKGCRGFEGGGSFIYRLCSY